MAITFPLPGVRSSSLDSECFSPVPFRKLPFQTQKNKIKKILVHPKQTVVPLVVVFVITMVLITTTGMEHKDIWACGRVDRGCWNVDKKTGGRGNMTENKVF